MKSPKLLPASALLACVILPFTARAAGENVVREARLYPLSFTSANQALNLVREPCQGIDRACVVNIGRETMISVWATPEAQTKVAELLRQADVPPRSQTFQIILLAAGMQALPKVDLPEGAARALAESSRLLPYKGYRMLEQGLLTTTDRGQIALGDPETGFEAQLRFEGGTDPTSALLVRSFEMARAKWEQAGENRFRRTVIETSFTIKPGETVVLGASRLNGSDQALVVLVTAVASN